MASGARAWPGAWQAGGAATANQSVGLSPLCAHVLVYHLTMPLSPLALEAVVTKLVILPVTLPDASYPSAHSHEDTSSKGN